MAGYRYWVGMTSCFLLFSLIFLAEKSGVLGGSDHEHHGETSLLLFMIPGFIASYLSNRKPLLCPLLGALYALPVCLLIRHAWLTTSHSFWQELAYVTSTVFWCVLGAMLFLVTRALLQGALRRHRDGQRH
ncbi:inner membrane protein YbjM [Serratia sp. NPDC078593]|uniref:inner membrane protein YbjM n=1 Tax=unclassified Serratia (in: enterobacteria) TaxID=2647522 RepID=UPI0037D8BB3E